jgi:hypothetical protein
MHYPLMSGQMTSKPCGDIVKYRNSSEVLASLTGRSGVRVPLMQSWFRVVANVARRETSHGASTMKTATLILPALSLVLLGSVSAVAQEITGTPGSPAATTTITGTQLPPPDPRSRYPMDRATNALLAFRRVVFARLLAGPAAARDAGSMMRRKALFSR